MPHATRCCAPRASISRSSPKDAISAAETVEFLSARHDHRARLIPTDLDGGLDAVHVSNDVRLELIAAERDFLYDLLRNGKITDEFAAAARTRSRP